MPSLKFDDLCAAIYHMDSKKLDLNLLAALEALLSERNVTRAANRLGISQPALSARLNRMRDVLGDPLFIPAQRGIVPTQYALELAAPLHAALEELRNVVASQAPFDPNAVALDFAIAASDYAHHVWTLPFIQRLRSVAPNCRIALHSVDRASLYKRMEQGEIDLAFLTPEAAPQNLQSRRAFTERYVVIGRKDHPRLQRPLDLPTFCALDHVLVSPRGGAFEGVTDIALQTLGASRRVAVSVASFLLVPEIVRRSDMIGLIPERLVKNDDSLRVVEPPLTVPGFDILMLWHSRSTSHLAHGWLRELLSSHQYPGPPQTVPDL
jgi:DNA-binding transcriptional LysR family regulator